MKCKECKVSKGGLAYWIILMSLSISILLFGIILKEYAALVIGIGLVIIFLFTIAAFLCPYSDGGEYDSFFY